MRVAQQGYRRVAFLRSAALLQGASQICRRDNIHAGCHCGALFSARRASSTENSAPGLSFTTNDPLRPSKAGVTPTSLPRKAQSSADELGLGVVRITSHNLNTQMDTKVPLLLYFMVENHPDVKDYTKTLCYQVDQANRRLKDAKMGDVYQEFGDDAGLAIKLGMIDCLAEPGLTTKFSIDPHLFPLVYFVWRRTFVDKLAGIVQEAQVKEAVESFLDFGKEESQNEREGKSMFQGLKREDNDDENAMTLLQMAHTKMQVKELAKARQLFHKSLEYSNKDIEIVNGRYGVGQKKMTQELWNKVKREPCYNTAPQALCGLGMCELAAGNFDEAKAYAAQIRSTFPFATKDIRQVAEAVVRIELICLTNFDVEKDNYISLLKYDELTEDPVTFYNNHLKLAVAHYIEGSPRKCIEECLKLIRAERKLFPALKEAGVVAPECELGPRAVTPARQVILGIFEALGSTNEHVVEGRKMLQLYL